MVPIDVQVFPFIVRSANLAPVDWNAHALQDGRPILRAKIAGLGAFDVARLAAASFAVRIGRGTPCALEGDEMSLWDSARASPPCLGGVVRVPVDECSVCPEG